MISSRRAALRGHGWAHLTQSSADLENAFNALARDHDCKCSSPALQRRSILQNDGRRASHRLKGAVELDVNEQCPAAPQTLRHKIRRLVHGLRALGLDAERTRKADEINLRIEELHADIAVGLLGEPAHVVQAL